ncbi:hypothetical protein D3C87_1007100 [compost metagenome]
MEACAGAHGLKAVGDWRLAFLVKKYIFFLVFFLLLFFLGGILFYFLLIPILTMMSTGVYEFPSLDRIISHGKFMVIVSPICAAAVTLLLKR